MGTVTPEPVDLVNAPPHYRQGGIECIDAIRAALGQDAFIGYCQGNALKYIWRFRHKGGAQDLAKAVYYLNEIIRNLNTTSSNTHGSNVVGNVEGVS